MVEDCSPSILHLAALLFTLFKLSDGPNSALCHSPYIPLPFTNYKQMFCCVHIQTCIYIHLTVSLSEHCSVQNTHGDNLVNKTVR